MFLFPLLLTNVLQNVMFLPMYLQKTQIPQTETTNLSCVVFLFIKVYLFKVYQFFFLHFNNRYTDLLFRKCEIKWYRRKRSKKKKIWFQNLLVLNLKKV